MMVQYLCIRRIQIPSESANIRRESRLLGAKEHSGHRTDHHLHFAVQFMRYLHIFRLLEFRFRSEKVLPLKHFPATVLLKHLEKARLCLICRNVQHFILANQRLNVLIAVVRSAPHIFILQLIASNMQRRILERAQYLNHQRRILHDVRLQMHVISQHLLELPVHLHLIKRHRTRNLAEITIIAHFRVLVGQILVTRREMNEWLLLQKRSVRLCRSAIDPVIVDLRCILQCHTLHRWPSNVIIELRPW
mmetsp:Transcript_6182/g.10204  ORF Transcript_6182/g.10204 Transcript_6182/m.10204 type:complete len:248 (+) Transcript_6182:518-1261(+)